MLAKTLVTPLIHDDVWRAFEIINAPVRSRARARTPSRTRRSCWCWIRDSRVYVSTRPERSTRC
ncbi:MAG: hypothetical protein MZW92_46635 [Comamonadaceae bacterium]|nr:hypothetical protein [Comamonadaceae bacterium]